MDRIAFIILAVLQLQASWAACADYSNSSPVELLQAYVQINTTTYHDLSEAVEFWRELAAVADVPINVYEIVEGFPIVVLKWAGADSSQRSIMLNSHMDVVPAALEDGWTYDPFSGHIDENNVMYGRGTQDMKSVSIQYYSALRRLKENNVTLLRDVYMTLMPDEEVGAEAGMIPFLQSEEFAAMNVGIELDEGSSFPMPIIAVFYQDKVVWRK
uniref:SFRICE_036886 n=1 Tax=Spodoptera frugiperda TaxID=7108 RepID=A0A2H1WX37_SPOFR